jgi:hypothetical protein
MSIDPNNPVIQLCSTGIAAEMKGDIATAVTNYTKAWDMRSTDFESCIVAHYMARLQSAPEDSLHWNLEALHYAHKVADDSVAAFYPSLYLNVGKAYEDMNDKALAAKYYELGIKGIEILPDDKLGNTTRDALKRGLERVQ